MQPWHQTAITQSLGIQFPVIQAGMAGGPTTPALVAAVSEAGGLGSIGGSYLTAEQLRAAIQSVRGLTKKPFAVNLFVPLPDVPYPIEVLEAMQQTLSPMERELGASPVTSTPLNNMEAQFQAQLEVVLEERVPVFSCTFGVPSSAVVEVLRQQGIYVIGTATTVNEAIALEQAGVHAIVAQGAEAGGHRGTFQGPAGQALVGTMALVPQIVDAVSVPVLASGGIMDGRGIAASMMLGAVGVQMGTAFLTTVESGAHEVYKEAIQTATETDTVVTTAFSGRAARGLVNRFIERIDEAGVPIPPYPIQNALTRPIRNAASHTQNKEYLSLWSGQGVRMAKALPASELLHQWVEQTNVSFNRFCSP